MLPEGEKISYLAEVQRLNKSSLGEKEGENVALCSAKQA